MLNRRSVACLLAFIPLAFMQPQRALAQFCDHAWTGILCVSCATYPATVAFRAWWWGCTGCISPCKTFITEEAPDATAEAKLALQRNPAAVSRQLQVTGDQLRDIGARNPWAASILYALEQSGPLADVKAGTSYLTMLPSAASIDAMLAGNDQGARAFASPATVRARVMHRLERGPDTSARLYLSSVVVDDDERVLYKVFPDIVVELYEAPTESVTPMPREGGTLKEAAAPNGIRGLVARSWTIAE